MSSALTFTHSYPVDGVIAPSWLDVPPDTSGNPFTIKDKFGLAASVQVVGDFEGSTVMLQVSNDGVHWLPLRDLAGDPIELTEGALAEFSSSALYIRPMRTGGISASVSVVMVLRG
ncbi:hypothetical protein [Epibacterium ulvae]|uniref:hypothetical protein n=1 Tax=Epibacterium ulvae TaxID=1156985 RepID=UPI0024929F49|nr:hypothetical protein [Epibacterium ulvae]